MKLPVGEIVTVAIIVVLGAVNLAIYTGVLDGFDPVRAGRAVDLPPGNAPVVPSSGEDAANDASPALPGRFVPSQGGRHTPPWPLDDDARVPFCGEGEIDNDCYASNPPTSGLHLPVTRDARLASGDVIDLPPPAGVYDFEIPREAIPHWQEHGGVYVGYRCGSNACLQLVEDLTRLVQDQIAAGRRVVMAPSSDLSEDTLAAASWTRVDIMTLAEYSRERVRQFIEAHSCRYDPENLCPE